MSQEPTENTSNPSFTSPSAQFLRWKAPHVCALYHTISCHGSALTFVCTVPNRFTLQISYWSASYRTLSCSVSPVHLYLIASCHIPCFQLVISSATLDAEKFSQFFDDAVIFIFPGRMYPVDVMYTKAPEADYLDAAVVTVLQVRFGS